MQTKTSSHIMGIDVSHHQPPASVDWMKLRAAGVQFVYIKATEGVTGKDDAMKQHYTGAKRAGLKVGFYHFARPYNDPRKEVENFLSTINGFQYDLPLVLDIESTEGRKPNEIAFFTKSWLVACEAQTKERPMIYTGAAFAKTNMSKELSKYPLWIAHYGAETPMGNDVWDKWTVFQYTSDGKVDGYNGRLDVNAAEPNLFNWRDDEMFKDVPDNHFAKKSIEKAANAGVIVGTAKDEFSPDQPLTRGQLAVILDRLGLLEKGGK